LTQQRLGPRRVVPHSGTPWWTFPGVIRTVGPQAPPVLDAGGWVDSSRIALLAFDKAQARLGKLRVFDLNERRDIVVPFDAGSAELIKVETR